MTTVHAAIINKMIKNANDTNRYYNAYDELVRACSDAPTQPTVTVSTTSTAPPPPSTPMPLGALWWKERQEEALKEQLEIIADQSKKIAELQKQIAEDKWHGTIKAGIDGGYRNHINELVKANGEMIQALQEYGLYTVHQSLVQNIKEVVQLCANRGKSIEDLKESLTTNVNASTQILESLNRNGLRQYDGSLADNVVDVIKQCAAQEKQIEALKKEVDRLDKHIENLKGFSRDDRDIINRKYAEIDKLKKQVSVANRKRDAIVDAGNKLRDLLREVVYYRPDVSEHHVWSAAAITHWEDNTK